VIQLDSTAGEKPEEALPKLVRAYVATVDSLRIVNVEAALEQGEKSNVYTTVGLILGAVALGFAATDLDESLKATLTGLSAAAGGLVASLNARFRHEEDATISAVCSRIAESELLSFRQPSKIADLHTRQEAFNSIWTDSGCGSTQIRRGVTPDPKPPKGDPVTSSAP
jgi:hypothetical protein